jgi:glyoxylase-like metal-dependent hydrolase (beta-lactamase superfamily II)
MTAWICATCGNQQADTGQPPRECAICLDERQYVGEGGQRWTTLAELAEAGHRSDVRELEPGLWGIGVEPAFAIGQRGLMVATEAGGVLFDVPGFADEAAFQAVRDAGGLAAVTASHPHFYGVIVEWSLAFGGAPVLIPKADLRWLQRPDPAVVPWEGTRELGPGVTLIQCGGHFPGSAVIHWAGGAGGKGALFVGDTLGVVADTRYLSFMRSYPNYIPLPERDLDLILERLEPYPFDRIYGGWWNRVVDRDGKAAVERSAQRYREWVRGDRPAD